MQHRFHVLKKQANSIVLLLSSTLLAVSCGDGRNFADNIYKVKLSKSYCPLFLGNQISKIPYNMKPFRSITVNTQLLKNGIPLNKKNVSLAASFINESNTSLASEIGLFTTSLKTDDDGFLTSEQIESKVQTQEGNQQSTEMTDSNSWGIGAALGIGIIGVAGGYVEGSSTKKTNSSFQIFSLEKSLPIILPPTELKISGKIIDGQIFNFDSKDQGNQIDYSVLNVSNFSRPIYPYVEYENNGSFQNELSSLLKIEGNEDFKNPKGYCSRITTALKDLFSKLDESENDKVYIEFFDKDDQIMSSISIDDGIRLEDGLNIVQKSCINFIKNLQTHSTCQNDYQGNLSGIINIQ
jgi:hypothetical protein